ncbi:MAG: DNA repair protein RecO [Eubacteriales bacterium]|jgi:DNA repair protein RecO (recombination protein O)
MKTNLLPSETLETRGLVLKANTERGANRALWVLTPGSGVLRVLAYGSGKVTSSITGGTQVFTLSDFTLLARRGIYRVEAAVCVEPFRALTADFTRYSLAAHLSEVLCDAAPAGIDCSNLYRLAVCAFYALTKPERDPELVRAAFTLRLLSDIGFTPDLDGDAMFFNVSEGTLAGKGVPLTPGALAAMRFILSAPYEKLFSFTLGSDSLQVLTGVCDDYLRTHIGREYPTLNYYRQIRVSNQSYFEDIEK